MTGLRVTHFVQRTTVTDVPVDGVASRLQVYVWDGGSFGSVPVTVTDGGFSFTTTLRPYWVGADGAWLVSSSDTLDFGRDVIGRATDTVYDGGQAYALQVAFTGLTSWVPGAHDLWMMTDAVDQGWGQWQWHDPVTAGATSVTGTLDFSGAPGTLPRLVDDSVVFTQQLTATVDGGRALDGGLISGVATTLVAATGSVALTLPPGSGVVSAAFAPLALKTATVAFDVAAFDLAAVANPLATSTRCGADVMPFVDLRRGATGLLGMLGSLTLRGLSAKSQTLAWGTPSPWVESASAHCHYTRTVVLPGTTSGVSLSGSAALFAPPLTLFSDVLRPVVTPPRDPRVDGVLVLTAPQTLAGPTPLISWTAPALGTPNVYFVGLSELTASGSTTVQSPETTFTTTATQLRVPPGVLRSGGIYALRITASNVSGGLFKADSAPLYDSASGQLGTVMTALLTVP